MAQEKNSQTRAHNAHIFVSSETHGLRLGQVSRFYHTIDGQSKRAWVDSEKSGPVLTTDR